MVVVMMPAMMAAVLDDDRARACGRDSENSSSDKAEKKCSQNGLPKLSGGRMRQRTLCSHALRRAVESSCDLQRLRKAIKKKAAEVMFSGRRLNLFGMKAPRPHPLCTPYVAQSG